MNKYQPVTTILKIKYKEGMKEECLQWMHETASIAGAFDGFVEKEIFVSAEKEKVLLNIFTFKNNDCLAAWENSVQRIEQTKNGEKFIEAIHSKSQYGGLEFMFSNAPSPKRWKMVLITVCVVFILLNSIVPFIQQAFTILHLPTLLKNLLGVAIMVSMMTFLILPFLSKLLARWLND